MFYSITILLLAFVLDLLIGEPGGKLHPVRMIGWLISGLEGICYGGENVSERGRKLRGGFFCVAVVLITALAVWGLLQIATLIHPLLGFLLEVLLCSFALSTKSLKSESMKVHTALKSNDIVAARTAVSMIVGRDTEKLGEPEITRAAIETVAENTTDGVIAPLLFMVIGGAPLGFLYKATNTLDSMVGYKNKRYADFGYFSAKLDDILNFIPARIAALLMLLASWLLGFDAKNAAKTWKSDRKKHDSPNSAQTESVCAGALGIRLAGDASYGGVRHKKPVLGAGGREAAPDDLIAANRLMYATAGLGIMIFLGAKTIILFLI